jgi:hypothetical protein
MLVDTNLRGRATPVFDGMMDGMKKDRFDFLQTFAKSFYGTWA